MIVSRDEMVSVVGFTGVPGEGGRRPDMVVPYESHSARFQQRPIHPRLRLRRLLRVRWAVLSESTGEVRDRWLVEEQGGGTRRPGDTNNPLYQHRGEPCRPDRGLSA